MSLSRFARRFESAASTLSNGGRRLLGLDTNPVPADWEHVTKVDPEAGKHLPIAFAAYLSHTDAVSVGGSRGVTADRTEETFSLVTDTPVPAFHEPSAADHVTPETADAAEFLAVPEVLNGDSEALIGTLGEGLDHVREDLGPELIQDHFGFSLGTLLGDRVTDFAAAHLMDQAVFEAYIIMNPDSAAAREANVDEDDLLTPDEARKRALAAEYHLESEVVYLEYSGTFGDEAAVDILHELDDAVSWGRIWYGGGLDSRDKVETVRDAGADTVVVGDIFHDIAEYEATVVEQARSHFDDRSQEDSDADTDGHNLSIPDSEDIHAWLTEEFDLAESPTRRYLSTVPAVDAPTEQAAEHLTAAVRFVLALDSVAAELDNPGLATLRARARDLQDAQADQVTDGTENPDSHPPLADIGDTTALPLTLTLLGSHFDTDIGDEGYARSHFAVDF